MSHGPKRFSINFADIRKTPIVRIEWMDACHYSGRFKADGSDADWLDTDWQNHDGSLLARQSTVGFLVRESQRAITVCTTISASNRRACELMTIPRAWIAKMTRLTVLPFRPRRSRCVTTASSGKPTKKLSSPRARARSTKAT
jgi:hypothetical protein